jgi:hypothetical protein
MPKIDALASLFRYRRFNLVKVTTAVQTFLANQSMHGGLEIAPNISDLEFQVFASPDGGDAVAGRRNTWTDGIDEWFHIRVPKNADTEPTYRDSECWRLDLHAQSIGTTGWNWRKRQSEFLGFDFDSLTNHAAGITDLELVRVREALTLLPYVEIRRSTSGKGLHAYVRLPDGVSTQNHTEHAALARSVLGVMSSCCAFDFSQAIDCCGSILWIWSRSASKEAGSFELIKAATSTFNKDFIPENWRDNVAVVNRDRVKVKLDAVSNADEDEFDALTGARRKVELDDQHRAHIDALKTYGGSCIWVPDHHMLQTHTVLLKRLHTEQNLEGIFETASGGSNLAEPNCFASPEPNGKWNVCRFGRGTKEAQTWTTNSNGWTSCKLNVAPDFEMLMELSGGGLLGDSKGHAFPSVRLACVALEKFGRCDVPALEDPLGYRPCVIYRDSKGNIVIQAEKEKSDNGSAFIGWNCQMKKGKWSRVLRVTGAEEVVDPSVQLSELDTFIRRCSLEDGQNSGWYHLSNNIWKSISESESSAICLALGVDKNEVQITRGTLLSNSWTVVNQPFKPEYPGGRVWNRNAAQYTFKPADRSDGASSHPHWDLILDHIGKSLDAPVRENQWLKAANINNGADYLTAWITCMLREPTTPIPYLFLTGPQNSGKSIFHEAISLLMTNGVVLAERVLLNRDGFNGELVNAILCVVEEVDLSRSAHASNRLKDLVTGQFLNIRAMRKDSYKVRNTTSWVQLANSLDHCPIFPGDSRITVCRVDAIEKEIAKTELLDRLTREAPHFMRTILDLQLPKPEGRLRIPIIETQAKFDAMEANTSPLETFLTESCHYCPGATTPYREWYSKFCESMPGDVAVEYRETATRSKLPDYFPVGKITGEGNVFHIGNMSLDRKTKPTDTKWTKINHNLVRG